MGASRGQERASDGFAFLCHPDDPSNARGGTGLGQLRAREAGSGFENREALYSRRAG